MMSKAPRVQIKAAFAAFAVFYAGSSLAAAPDLADPRADTARPSLDDAASAVPEAMTLGLMGTIPIYWGEADGLAQQISGDFEMHWAREFLERDFVLAPLDYLSSEALSAYQRLFLAQPRGFSGEENVALDEWVRSGGQLLLFADPWMTGHSRFTIGDRRRPQDIILLSPLLNHWGLGLEYDEDGRVHSSDHEPSHLLPGTSGSPLEERHGMPSSMAVTASEEIDGVSVPISLAGRFSLDDAAQDCVLSQRKVLVQCAIGKGSVVILADAALLDLSPVSGAEKALAVLLSRAFGPDFPRFGENRGQSVSERSSLTGSGGNQGFLAQGNPLEFMGDPAK